MIAVIVAKTICKILQLCRYMLILASGAARYSRQVPCVVPARLGFVSVEDVADLFIHSCSSGTFHNHTCENICGSVVRVAGKMDSASSSVQVPAVRKSCA